MKILLDTQLAIWAAGQSHELPIDVRSILEDRNNDIVFSVINIWEIAIKRSLNRSDFTYEPNILRTALLANEFLELEVKAGHAIGITKLPLIHKDPFDRLLIAQAISEDMLLLTTDRKVADYPGPIRLV